MGKAAGAAWSLAVGLLASLIVLLPFGLPPWLAALVGLCIAVAIAIVLTIMDKRGRRHGAEGPKPPIISGNATSYNQSGGITAGVYVGTPARRRLDQVERAALAARLSRFAGTKVDTVGGIDPDSVKLGADVGGALAAAGWSIPLGIAGIYGMVWDGVRLYHATTKPGSPALLALASELRSIGVPIEQQFFDCGADQVIVGIVTQS